MRRNLWIFISVFAGCLGALGIFNTVTKCEVAEVGAVCNQFPPDAFPDVMYHITGQDAIVRFSALTFQDDECCDGCWVVFVRAYDCGVEPEIYDCYDTYSSAVRSIRRMTQ